MKTNQQPKPITPPPADIARLSRWRVRFVWVGMLWKHEAAEPIVRYEVCGNTL